jgi:hypothetical protein
MIPRYVRVFASLSMIGVMRSRKLAILALLCAGLTLLSSCSTAPQQTPIVMLETPTTAGERPVTAQMPPTVPVVETAPEATTEPEATRERTPTAVVLPTATPASLPTMDMPLPRGVVPDPTELYYGPKHPSMVILPAGTEFVLLGKNREEEKLKEGTWFRVQIYSGPEVGRVGWLKAEATRPETLAANTNIIPSPPSCAKALANSLDDFQGADRSLSTMGIWESTHTGDTAFVIDIYRQIAGELSPKLTFILEANGQRVALPEEIKPTRKSFIWRGLVVHADLKRGDTVRMVLQASGGPLPDEISWFVSVYSVPEGCTFNQ